MRVSELINAANDLADETETAATIVNFLNDAIARINTECRSSIPSLSLVSDDEPEIPEKWQRTLLIPFVVGRIKQKDSSQFEYSDAYQQFLDALEQFKANYVIPKRYRDLVPEQTILIDNEGTTYVTWSGDNLQLIADDHNVPVEQLIDLNPNIQFDTGSYASDIYENPPFPWMRW